MRNHEDLPEVLKLLIEAAASAGVHGQTIYHVHADVNYKALSTDDQALVNQTYYEAVKYAQDEAQEELELSGKLNNIDLLV